MRFALVFALVLLASSTSAQEHRGCDAFTWPIEVERAALTSEQKQALEEGVALDRNSPVAIAVELLPFDDAALRKPPERAPENPDSFAISLDFPAAEATGRYRVSLDTAGWIDAIQSEEYLKPTASTGATECAGIRKSVEFEIGPEPFVLQLSDVPAQTISVVLTPAP